MDQMIKQEWRARYEGQLPRRVSRLIDQHLNKWEWCGSSRDSYLEEWGRLLRDDILMSSNEHLAYDILCQVNQRLKRQEQLQAHRHYHRRLSRYWLRSTQKGGHRILPPSYIKT